MMAKEKFFMILQSDTINMTNDNVERMLSKAQLYKKTQRTGAILFTIVLVNSTIVMLGRLAL